MKKLNFKILEKGLDEEKLNSFSFRALNSNIMDKAKGGKMEEPCPQFICDDYNPCTGGTILSCLLVLLIFGVVEKKHY
jgi:hypothetical protein